MKLLLLVLHLMLFSGGAAYDEWRTDKVVKKMRAEAQKN